LHQIFSRFTGKVHGELQLLPSFPVSSFPVSSFPVSSFPARAHQFPGVDF